MNKESAYEFGLEDNTGDIDYLNAVETALDAVKSFNPDLMLYISGADVLKSDRLGRLSLSLDGLKRRDKRVFQFAKQNDIPISFALGGGYADSISETVKGYAATLSSAREVFEF